MRASLPGPVRSGVEAALEAELGRPATVKEARSVGGGCISPAVRIATSDGDDFFVKWSDDGPPGLFGAEADGLTALRAGAGRELRVPQVLAVEDSPAIEDPVPAGPSWLLMEFVAEGAGGEGYATRLGRGLATLHRHGSDGPWGWERDNFIGSLPQANDPLPGWPEFWAERRLGPQLRMAVEEGRISAGRAGAVEEILSRMDEALDGADESGPSLLHGDLWGGNVFPDASGTPTVIDPAVYRGHREVDLAMSELFGFPSGFLPAYREAWPVDEAYDRLRRPLYQLYYLLVHVNLFGGGYVAGTLDAAERVLAELG